MNIRAKAAFSAATIMLVAAGATGCGGGDSSSGSSKSASKTDFCNAFETFDKNIAKAATGSDASAIIKTIKAEAKKLRSVGTPSSISSDEKSGYGAVLDAIDGLPDNATAEDLSNVEDKLSATDKKNSAAFQKYLDKECPSLNTGS